MDEFTRIRILRLIGSFKKSHGRDINEAELKAGGVSPADLDHLVRDGLLDKYQVTAGAGNVENRYKVHRDWRELKPT